MIKEADKGSMVVILNKNFYRTLSNTEIYKKEKKNIDTAILSFLANKFYHLGVLTFKKGNYISNFNFTTANLYGNPKVHKSKSIKEAITDCKDTYLHIKTDDEISRNIWWP